MLHRLTLRVLPRLAKAVTGEAVRKRKRLVMLAPGLVAFVVYRFAKQVVPLADPLILLALSGTVSALAALWAYRMGRQAAAAALWREDGIHRLGWVTGWIGFAYGVQLSLMVLALLKLLVQYDFLQHPDGPAMMAIIIACTSVARDAFEIGHVRRLEVQGESFLTFPDGGALRRLIAEQAGRLAWLTLVSAASVAVVAACLAQLWQEWALDRPDLAQLIFVMLAAGSLAVAAYLKGERRTGGWKQIVLSVGWRELFRFWWWPGLAFAATYFLAVWGAAVFLLGIQGVSAGSAALIAGVVAGTMALYGYYLGYRRQLEDRVEQTVPPSLLRCPFVFGILSKTKPSPAEEAVRPAGAVSMRVMIVGAMVLAGVLTAGGPAWAGDESSPQAESAATDVYYKTKGIPAGPPAPALEGTRYPRYGTLDNRLLVWFVTQQHTYFGGFVLALPIFCVIIEFLGLISRDPASAARYDRLARDFLKVALLALSLTAIVGSVMLALFITLYPSFMSYMGGTFKTMMPIYALVFLGESLLLIAYYYSWDRMVTPALKWMHASLGVVANGLGAVLLLLANAWIAFMMSPAGVDGQGRYLGNAWHLLHSALWNPLNVHRFLADLMSGGAVVIAYAAYRFLTSKSDEERAYYDWVGYIFLFVTVCALLPMPFAGYWLMRSVYAFRQSMGVTMMGGLLTWLFVVQALLIGVLFLGINYYLWQSMGRIRGGERYQDYLKYLVVALAGCLFVWLTPHTVLMAPGEVKAMGGAQHPVIGNYGVMSAKNGAINVMICLTALSYILYRRANRTMTISWVRAGNLMLAVLFTAGIANIVWLAIYGFYLPAAVRVGLSSPQALTTFTVLCAGLLINRAMLHSAKVHGPIEWGKISMRGMLALFGLAATFTWVMGLMGYIRSSGRLSWHVSEIMADVSPWAFTPSLGFAAKMVTLNMVVFWSAVLLLFWISSRDREASPAANAEPAALPTTGEVQPS